MMSILAGRKKPSIVPIIIGIAVLLIGISFIFPVQHQESIDAPLESSADFRATQDTENPMKMEDDEFFVRVQVDGYTIDHLTIEDEFIQTDYVNSSDFPYTWPYDVVWEVDDFTDTSASLVTITVPGKPNVSTVLTTLKFSVTTTGSSENQTTIVVVSSSDPGTFVFQYGEKCYYFSVVS